MNRSIDPLFDQRIAAWLEEDPNQAPDQALDTILAAVPSIPQRRRLPVPWRTPTMNTRLRLAAGIAIVAIVGYAGLTSLNPPSGPGTTPTPAPSSTPVASSPTVTPVPLVPEGSIEAGTYSLDRNLGITIEVPDGWEGCCGFFAIQNGETPPAFAALGYDDLTNIFVYSDSCHWESSAVSEPHGAEAIAAALAAQPGRTEPRDVTVGGLPGFHVRLTVPADPETTEQPDGDATFVACDQGEFRTYGTAGSVRYQLGLSQVDDLYIVEVGSRAVMFDVSYFEETAAADRDALDAMLASVRIE